MIYKISKIVFLTSIASAIVANAYFYNFYYEVYINFLENFSYDANLKYPVLAFYRVNNFLVFFFIISTIVTSKKYATSFLMSFNGSKNIDKLASLIIIVLILFFFIFDYNPFSKNLEFLYAEDGFFENVTALFALAASIILIASINSKEETQAKIFKLFFSTVFLLFCMEEISWGQRFFGWETPSLLQQYNSNKEINFHNLFNFIYPLAYPAISLLIALVLFNIEKVKIRTKELFSCEHCEHLFPGNESVMYGFFFLFFFFSSLILVEIQYDDELMEEALSVFMLTYSINQFTLSGGLDNQA